MFKAPVASRTSLTDQAAFLANNTSTNTGGQSQFGPGMPMKESPLGGDPRLWQFNPNYNMINPASDRKGRVSTETLRLYATTYDLLARCLARRKEEIRTLHWSIVPKERANKKKMREVQEKYADDIKFLTEMFKHPEATMKKMNGKWVRFPISDYQSWLNAVLDDMFVVGSMAVVPVRKNNGDLLGVERVDAATIKPLLDDGGRIPTSGPAYQQWLYGYPRHDFEIHELIYRGYYQSNQTPYAYSLVEQILAHIQLAIRNETFLSAYFNEGALPNLLLTAPEEWSIDQLLQFTEILNSRLSGNAAELRKFNIVPHGTEKIDLKPFDFDDRWVNFISCQTAVLCGVQPSEIGLSNHESGLGGKGASEQAAETNDKQTMFVSEYLQSMFTDIIQFHFQNDEIQFVFDHLLEKEERERTEIDSILLDSGLKSLDQILVEKGENPEGVSRFKVVGDRIYFLPDLVAGSVKGSVAVNLGAIGGVPMPESDTFTEDVPLTQDAPQPGVTTPNPNQPGDPAAKVDTSHTEQPDAPDNKPAQPPKAGTGANGPTVNTVGKSTMVDMLNGTYDMGTLTLRKDTQSDDNDKHHLTHLQELLLAAWLLRLWRRRPMSEHYITPHLAQSAFTMSPHDTQQLSDAIYDMKSDIYVESWNTMARADGRSDMVIDRVPPHVEVDLCKQASDAAQSVTDTHNAGVQSQMDKLAANGVTEPGAIVDALNQWQKQVNEYKPKSISVTEAGAPHNRAILDYDHAVGHADDRLYNVSPDQCACDVCRNMVANNPYTHEQAKQLKLPVHVNCIHYLTSMPKQVDKQ